MTATFKLYERVVEDRPFKLDAEEVGYREAGTDPACQSCVHFYKRVTDGFGVCEIFRDADTDEVGINPKWTCSFHTVDGEEFPLLEGEDDDDERED